ncbi:MULTISPECIES: aspartyl-phosphate phosphatase Spo0E family protein [Bacillaceae]|uniref:aspartyl-phosphate phosphatase Spo0E family protein n=1 Tax=Bacillaceae TaxID=186817 RepID=UPI000C78FDA9|nr:MULTISPECIES: aspartyl-phosphate phosphatase Spo0E family protein [Bacillaceae]PLR69858.1 Spo0A-P phosphatase [Bacillus sp. UMB0893]QNG58668.1 aspartyl-phosphate phosphatase Spo0E family protein [Bacillus sp. PAMC26568]
MSKQELLKLIEKKRAEMIDIAIKNGINSNVSIQYSQELDHLLNEYNRYSYTTLKKVSYS